MTRILWLSRHEPTVSQRRALVACELIIDRRRLANADDAWKRFHDSGADEAVVIAPLTLLRALAERGVYPIYPQMVPCPEAEGEIQSVHGRWVRFACFRRLKRVSVEFDPEPVTFEAGGRA